jgi:thiol-disulfide isomerase/thioredoxin
MKTNPPLEPMKEIWIILLALLTVAAARADQEFKDVREGTPAQRKGLDALEGKLAPPLQVTDWLNGHPAALADLKGKIVVLDFWAIWCGPCIASIPHNNALSEKYQEKGVVFIGVCHSRGADKMEATVKEKGLKYATAKDPDGATVKAYQVNSFPDYYVIDRKGLLRVADCKNKMVEDVIEALLEERCCILWNPAPARARLQSEYSQSRTIRSPQPHSIWIWMIRSPSRWTVILGGSEGAWECGPSGPAGPGGARVVPFASEEGGLKGRNVWDSAGLDV